jgi:hypothetical protein
VPGSRSVPAARSTGHQRPTVPGSPPEGHVVTLRRRSSAHQCRPVSGRHGCTHLGGLQTRAATRSRLVTRAGSPAD